jgi:WD40 repeat protein
LRSLTLLPAAPAALILQGHAANVLHLSFSLDGSRVRTASADGTWRVWSARSGETLQAGGTAGGTAAFSADGAQLVTVTRDEARVVSIAANRPPMVLRGHEGPVQAVCFSRDGTRVATASADKTARVWTVEWASLIRLLLSSTTACLTPQQRAEFLGESNESAEAATASCDRAYGRSPQR